MNKSLYNFDYTQAKPEEPVGEPIPVDARFVRTKETGDKVYLLLKGKKHWITSPEVLTALGGDFGQVVTIEYSIAKTYVTGETLTASNVGNYITQLPVKELVPSQPQIELKAHTEAEQPVPENAPKAEPEKGLTSIIIPAYLINYPIFHMTGNCIGSIREHTDREKTPYEIILVLNGTKDSIKFDNFGLTYAEKVIPNEENKGYAYAVNQGIRCARGEYIAIVNNDVQVYHNWLADLQSCLNGTDQFLDLVMATPMYGMPYARAKEAFDLRKKWIGKQVKESLADFKDFSCVLTRKQLFAEIGLFNEEFFMYGEDLDLMRRMDQAGKKYASTKLVNTHHVIQGTGNYVEGIADIMNQSKEKLKQIWGK